MKELSLNILDIAQNSVKAKADKIDITIEETDETMLISVEDNGCGMTADFLESVTNPFTTTRTTRSVGLGIPLLQLAAAQTGGSVEITSRHKSEYPDNHGTRTSALFYKNHIDFTPLGDIASTVVTLIQGQPGIEWNFLHSKGDKKVELHTEEMKEKLGDVPLDNFEVITWIGEYLREQYDELS
ncbi:MAG: sensor histidine kinase [Clostridia bacterium]|nr:sensor histidine kinase [Clostridia bacterium]